jgi:hypothetical protein
MCIQNFLIKTPFDDLEIKTNDEKSLYISKAWMHLISPHFQAMLVNGFSESKQSIITLGYEHTILNILFNCVMFAHNGEDFVRKHFFTQLGTKEKICEFFSATNEYEFNGIKQLAEEHFSTDEHILKFFSAELVTTIYQLDLNKMKKQVLNLFRIKNLPMKNIKFDLIECVTLNFFRFNWKVYLSAIQEWLKYHDPIDEELEHSQIFVLSEKNFPKTIIDLLVEINRKFTKAPKTNAIINAFIVNILYPPLPVVASTIPPITSK